MGLLLAAEPEKAPTQITRCLRIWLILGRGVGQLRTQLWSQMINHGTDFGSPSAVRAGC
jgi:hypothetical protein